MGSVLASGASAAVGAFKLKLLEQYRILCMHNIIACLHIHLAIIYQSDLEIQSMFNFTSDDSS